MGSATSGPSWCGTLRMELGGLMRRSCVHKKSLEDGNSLNRAGGTANKRLSVPLSMVAWCGSVRELSAEHFDSRLGGQPAVITLVWVTSLQAGIGIRELLRSSPTLL